MYNDDTSGRHERANSRFSNKQNRQQQQVIRNGHGNAMDAGGFGFSRPNGGDPHTRYELQRFGVEGIEQVRYQNVSTMRKE